MYCAECGERINVVKCCRGLGYWYDKPPLPQDFIKLRQCGRWYLYLSGNWPKGLKVVEPKEGH